MVKLKFMSFSISGVTFRQNEIKTLVGAYALPVIFNANIVPESDNKYDSEAKKVMVGDYHVGYIPKGMTRGINNGQCQVEISYWTVKNLFVVNYLGTVDATKLV
jgi:hypothetical protein